MPGVLTNIAIALGIASPGVAGFLNRYHLKDSDISAPKRRAVEIATGEWSRQLTSERRARIGFAAAQFVAPVAAATATVLAAFTSTSAWAVIPSAVATVAASLLAAFGLRGIWLLRRNLRADLAQEIIDFVLEYRDYRKLQLAEQVDRLMNKVSAASTATAPSSSSG
jgi:hypothetical protein